jgi:DNA-directed RNA polymerase specialized sigma24 family protein
VLEVLGGELVVGAHHVDQRAQRAAQPGRERRFGVKDRPAGRRVLSGVARVELLDQFFLGAEVVVGVAGGHPGFMRNGPHRGCLIAGLAEQAQRRLDDRGPGLLRLAAVILNTFNTLCLGTRRSSARPDDDEGVSGQRLARENPARRFLDLYDRALPQVYGYLLARCEQRAVAEDLTAETFLAAVDAVRGVRGGPPAPLSTGWLMGVARHKLCDHWRRQAREERTLRAVAAEPEPGPGGVPVSLVLTVADVDDVVAAAVEAGARLDRQPYEGYGHRNATVTDPYGHRWLLQAPLPGAAAEPAREAEPAAAPLRQGDIS